MILGYVLAISSEQRLRVLAERSAYVIAVADRGQFDICCGTELYGRSSEKALFFRDDLKHNLKNPTTRSHPPFLLPISRNLIDLYQLSNP